MSGWAIGQHVVLAGVTALGTVTSSAPPAPEVRTVCTLQDPAITESSGLVEVGDRLLTHNDSGDGPFVYVVDPATGRTVGRTTYSSGPVTDVEAMSVGPDGSVWMGDIGDNTADRDRVSVYRLPPVHGGDRTVPSQRYDLRYPDGPTNAETLMVDPRDGRLFIVGKGLFGGRVYEAPRTLSPQHVNLLKPVGRADGLVTDGSFFPDGEHVVLRTYGSAAVYDTATWQPQATMRLPAQPQGEGITVVDGGRRVLLSSEGVHTPILSVPLSRGMRAAAGVMPDRAPSSTAHDRPTAAASRGHESDVPAAVGPALAVLAGLLGGGWLLGRRRRQRRSTT